MSLSVRLLLLVMLAVMPAIFIEINGEVTLRAAREREMREEALRLTRAVAAEQARIGEGARQLLLAFSEIADVYAGNRQACAEAARRIRGQVEGYVNIGLASTEGDVLCSAVPLPPGVDFRNNKMLPAVDDVTSLSVGTYQVGRLTGVKLLFYTVPQRDADGRVVGVLWAAVSLDWLARHFASRFTSENITLLIADRDGTILVRLPEFEEWVGKYIGDRYMPWLFRDREGVEESTGIDGVDRVIAYSPLSVEPRDIYIGVGLSKGPLFAPIDAATRQGAMLISLGFLLALLAAWLGGNAFIRRPIESLLAVARRWQQGDYGARARLEDRTSEIGTLGAAFDVMADALERREQQRRSAEEALASLNADLEQRVKAEIAEREKAQTALLHAQKIEAVGQLTSGVAHDFNNLLAAVLGNLELLRGRVAEPRGVQLIDGAVRAAERGAKLTQQLLAFSRRHHLEPAPFDANDLIAGMHELLARTIGPSVRIRESLAGDLWPAMADPSHVEVALLNLAINARDAMPLGGSLLLETANLPSGHVRLPPELIGDYVMIAVSDDGAGMTPDVKARAFEPFFTTKEVGKGTGLGLSMVYGVAKQAGGAVTLESAPGQGTTVVLFLPRAAKDLTVETARATATPSPEVQRSPPRARILVVDDDRDVRDVMLTALADHGYDTRHAETGWAALDLLERDAAIDFLVVDFAMPGLNGTEVALRAREKRPTLPILLITGYANAEILAKMPAGVQLLRKPFRVAELVARVAHGLATHPDGSSSNVLTLRPTKT